MPTDNRRMEYLRALSRDFCADEDDVEVRSLIAFSLRVADHFIAVDHGGRTPAEMADLTREWLLR
ncbi:hypothetical protein ACWFR1_09335 [Streptomyces sp. NPDC055103]